MSSSQIIQNPSKLIPTYSTQSSSLFYFKLLYSLIIIIITEIFGIIPLCFNNCSKDSLTLNYANAFSGGIFLGIGLFHLFPDANNDFFKYFSSPEGKKSFIYNWPISYLLVFTSYSFILFLEKVVFSERQFINNKNNNISNILNKNDMQDPLLEEEKLERKLSNNSYSSLNNTATTTPYILLIALSIHGIFEGIALGVMNTQRNCFLLFIAIIVHKWAESFALGISFFKSGFEQSLFIKMITIFTLFCPLGIFIGMYFTDAGFLMRGIMLSLSGGTFLYVATSEVIVEEFSMSQENGIKFLWYLFGAILTFVITLIQ